MNKNLNLFFAAGLGATLALPVFADEALEMMKRSFKSQGQAPVERVYQDQTQALCSQYKPGRPIPKPVSARIEKINMASIDFPKDTKSMMGDWRRGERVAQSGIGMQFSDEYKRGAGANCYACHQLSPQEISYGTIGPSLRNFGKTRGNSEAIIRYTWGKIYNAQAYSACSNMPRFGANGILTGEQIADLVALLLDPNSPVNK